MFDFQAGVLRAPLTKWFLAEANEMRNCFLFVGVCVELLHDRVPLLSLSQFHVVRLKLIEKPQQIVIRKLGDQSKYSCMNSSPAREKTSASVQCKKHFRIRGKIKLNFRILKFFEVVPIKCYWVFGFPVILILSRNFRVQSRNLS